MARDLHLSFQNQPLTLADAKFSFLTIVADRCHIMSIGKDEVEELIETNNAKLLDSFQGLLEETASQIKRQTKNQQRAS